MEELLKYIREIEITTPQYRWTKQKTKGFLLACVMIRTEIKERIKDGNSNPK